MDKYLKTSRLIKRRTIAKEACEQERITINGRTAKAGSEVKEGDVIEVRLGNAPLTVRVMKITESCKKEDAAEMYEAL